MTVYGTGGHIGALVLSVDGDAQKRGLQVGDVIVGYDNREISSVCDISSETDWANGKIVVLRKQLRIIL